MLIYVKNRKLLENGLQQSTAVVQFSSIKGLCLTGPDSKGSQEIDQNSSKLPKIAFRIALKQPLIFPLKGSQGSYEPQGSNWPGNKLKQPGNRPKQLKIAQNSLQYSLKIAPYSPFKGQTKKKNNFTTRTPMLSNQNKAFPTKIRPF